MSIDLGVSAYSNTSFLDWDSIPPEQVQEGEGGFRSFVPGPDFMKHFKSPDRGEILAWRERLMAEHPGYLRAESLWDEEDEFEDGAPIYTAGLEDMCSVAIMIDQRGEAWAAASLRGLEEIEDHARAIEDATESGPGQLTRFPQIVLASHWLPTDSPEIVEASDYNGDESAFGSLPRLEAELKDLQATIVRLQPGADQAGEWDDSDEPADLAPTVLGRAWQCAATFRRLAQVAMEHRLPMWISE